MTENFCGIISRDQFGLELATIFPRSPNIGGFASGTLVGCSVTMRMLGKFFGVGTKYYILDQGKPESAGRSFA